MHQGIQLSRVTNDQRNFWNYRSIVRRNQEWKKISKFQLIPNDLLWIWEFWSQSLYLPTLFWYTYTLILHASVYVGWNGIQYTTLKAAFAAAWTCHTFDFTYWRFKMQVLKIPNFHKLLKTQARFFFEMDGGSAAGHEKIVRQKFKTICTTYQKKIFYGKMSPDMMGCL